MARTDDYLTEISNIAARIDRNATDRAIGILYSAWKGDNQVFVIGNAGSAQLRRKVIRSLQLVLETCLGRGRRFDKDDPLTWNRVIEYHPVIRKWKGETSRQDYQRKRIEQIRNRGIKCEVRFI